MVAIRAVNGTFQVLMEPAHPPAPAAERHPHAPGGKTLPPATGDRRLAREENVEQAVGDVERYVQSLQRRLHFSVDAESGRTIIRVLDRETNQVIRQIPGEEMLALSKRLRESAGMLLREQA